MYSWKRFRFRFRVPFLGFGFRVLFSFWVKVLSLSYGFKFWV